MAKNKKHFSASDYINRTKSAVINKKNKYNPFEVHVNKEKFSILGRKLKHDKGMPGVSRGKALQRRKDTLGQEYLNKHKANKFRDKRIGEKYMTKDQAANARFMAEQLNKLKTKGKHTRYNLNDDLMLTHRGQTLEEIEQFKDDVSNDDDEVGDDELGKLDEEFTASVHFGGGKNGNRNAGESDGKGRKETIDQFIIDQKKRRIEIAKDKEEVQEMTDLLDANWRNIIPLIGKLNKSDEMKPKPDDYDRTLREMIFEPRGAVSDKLKSEEEILKAEKAKLDKLEKERRDRMEDLTINNKNKHRSADDLDASYFIQPVMDNIEEPISDDHLENSRSDEDLDVHDQLTSEERLDKENSTDEDCSLETDGSDNDDHDSMNDLKDSSSSDSSSNTEDEEILPEVHESKQNLLQNLPQIEKVSVKLPFTFDLPNSYEDLENLLQNHNAQEQQIIVERMIKSNHPKLLPENKEKMIHLFAFMMQHINDIFQSVTSSNVHRTFDIFHRLNPHLFDLFNINPSEMTKSFREIIIEKQAEYRNDPKRFPTLDTLVFLKLVPLFYSTSDFHHSIATPSLIFISQLLTRCRTCNRNNIARGLFLVALVLEYTKLSRKFLPAAMNFLVGIFFLAVRKSSVEIYKVPFHVPNEFDSLLVLDADCRQNHNGNDFGIFLNSKDLLEEHIDNGFKVRALNSTILLTWEMLNILSINKSCQYLAEPIDHLINKINFEFYPKFVHESRTKLCALLAEFKEKVFAFPTGPVKKPKSLRMLEPIFDKVYDDKRTRNDEKKPKAIRQGLIRKIKSETRGAIREIRRDNAFLANIELKKKLRSDKERKEKVRRLFSEASIQQGELNAMDRKKKHL